MDYFILDYFSGKRLRKVVKHAKLAIPSDFRPCQWEKIGKVAKCVKLAVWTTSVGKD